VIGRDKTKRPRTTLLVPCFNEAEGIPQLCALLVPLVRRLRRSGGVEVVFVDDGSTDSTADIIRREAVRIPYRIVTHEHNRGLGAALRTGFAASAGQEVVTLDSDCTYVPLEALRLLEVLRNGCDIVTGSPYHPDGEVVGVQGWRLFLSKSLSRLYWMILPLRLYTYTSCFRAYRREILPNLQLDDDGFLAVTQLLISAILKGFSVVEVPARLTKRQFGQSKIRVVRVVISHIRYIFYVIFLRMSHRVQNVA
jgi:dolichol-phosphate mannosyltransferase